MVPLLSALMMVCLQKIGAGMPVDRCSGTVWLSILNQFNFFVNGNAKMMRNLFVSHEGKIDLTVVWVSLVPCIAALHHR
jgi:hypothetical protein